MKRVDINVTYRIAATIEDDISINEDNINEYILLDPGEECDFDEWDVVDCVIEDYDGENYD